MGHLQLYRLESRDASRFSALTFRHMHGRLARLDEDRSLVAFGVEMTSGPTGLILAEYRDGWSGANLMSLYVSKSGRRLGAATALMHALESELKPRGCMWLRITYYAGKTDVSPLEQFLHHNSWERPRLEGHVYKADVSIATAPWLRQLPLPEGVDCFRWTDMTEREAEALRLREREREFPDYVSPFKQEHDLEQEASFFLRARGEVAGWSVVFRIAPDTWLYDSIYVTSGLRNTGIAFNLLSRSVQYQLETGVPYAMFAVNADTPVMPGLVERRLKPYTVEQMEKRVCYKTWIT